MRLSLGSVALLVAALFVAFAFWPENHAIQGPPQVLADNKPQPKSAAKTSSTKTTKPNAVKRKPELLAPASDTAKKMVVGTNAAAEHPLSSDIGQNPTIEEALEMRTDFSIEPEPLRAALDWIAQRYQFPLLLDNKALEDANIDTSTEVKMLVSGLKLRQMLNLLLQQLPQPLGYDIEDGVLRISTVEQIHQHTYVVIYDCRDLIHLRSMYPGNAANSNSRTEAVAGSGGGTFSASPESATVARQFGGARSANGNKDAERPEKRSREKDEIPLIRVIKYAGDPDDWEQQEGAGPRITEIGGLLVVNQNPMVHEQIKRILADLRRMRKDGAFANFDHVNIAPVANTSRPARPGGL